MLNDGRSWRVLNDGRSWRVLNDGAIGSVLGSAVLAQPVVPPQTHDRVETYYSETSLDPPTDSAACAPRPPRQPAADR